MMNKTLSITGKTWRMRLENESTAFTLAGQTGLPEMVSRILAGRGVTAAEDALPFLTPKLADLPDPMHLLDMDKAVERLVSAIKNKETICVFGDYDVDGGCASAILLRYFRNLGLEPLLYIPDRTTEGYGPNPEAMEAIQKMGAQVVITVDCGSVAFEPMARAAELGLDVIITDHHQTMPEQPACVALINPNRVDETSECTMLSGGGVAFYLVLALNRVLREQNWFTEHDIKEPDNRFLLDLVAVSTVCDMVPLTGPNRVLVRQGLKVLGRFSNAGFAAMAAVAGVDDTPSAYHAGFVFGPRINAGGRISDCDLGAKLLSTLSDEEARTIAERLELLNAERKVIEQEVLDKAMVAAAEEMKNEPSALVLAGEGWHPGVIGIVASRIKEKYHRPTFILAIDAEEGVKGSGRSISGIDLGKAVIDCKKAEVIIQGGGHKMAAGVSLEAGKISAFREKLDALVAEQAKAAGRDVFQPIISLDGFLSPSSVSTELMENLQKLEPYGSAHPEPRFVFSGVKIAYAKGVGADGSHISFSFESGTSKKLRGIAFGAGTGPLGALLLKAFKTREPVSLCGSLRPNVWQGVTTYQLHLHDAQKGKF